MKRGGGKRKGGSFERKIAKMLSLWWSNDVREDIFVRNNSSGARATVRAKQGKQTINQSGDITTVSEEGFQFIRNFHLEVKFYKSFSFGDLIYRNKGQLTKWWGQGKRDADRENKYTLLILKQNGYPEIIIFPYLLYRDTLYEYFGKLKHYPNLVGKLGEDSVMIMILSDFLNCVDPQIIKNMLEFS